MKNGFYVLAENTTAVRPFTSIVFCSGVYARACIGECRIVASSPSNDFENESEYLNMIFCIPPQFSVYIVCVCVVWTFFIYFFFNCTVGLVIYSQCRSIVEAKTKDTTTIYTRTQCTRVIFDMFSLAANTILDGLTIRTRPL